MPKLEDKKAIIYGETNNLFASDIAELLVAGGAQIIGQETSCLSWGSGESVGVADQKKVKDAIDQYGSENVIVVVGFTNTYTLGTFQNEDGEEEGRIGHILVKTFWEGDPGGAGPLKQSNPPRIKTYSIFEFEKEIPKEKWKELGMHRKKRGVRKEVFVEFIDRLKELRGD